MKSKTTPIQIICVLLLALLIAFVRNYTYTFQLTTVPFIYHGLLGGVIGWALFKRKKTYTIFAQSLLFFIIILTIPNFNFSDLFLFIPTLIGILIGFVRLKIVLKIIAFFILIVTTWYIISDLEHNKSIQDYNVTLTENPFKFVDSNYIAFPPENGKVKIVELWFVNCKPCKEELIYVNDFKKDYESNPNVEFYTFNIANESEDKIKTFLKDINVSCSVGLDTNNFFKSLTGLSSFPQLLILDRNNRLRTLYHGFKKDRVFRFDYWLKTEIENLSRESLID